MQIAGVTKGGKIVGELTRELIKWQLGHLDGSPEEAEAYMREHVAATKSAE